MKVKTFVSSSEVSLEERINEFIEEIKKEHWKVKDIKFTTNLDSNGICFSALVMYEPDDRIILVSNSFGGVTPL